MSDNGDFVIDEGDLQAAVDAAVINARQAQALEAFLRKRAAQPITRDENFRIASNFGDIFIVIGLVIFTLAAFRMERDYFSDFEPLGAVAMLAIYWLLAELFVFRQPRLAPAIIACLLCAYLVCLIFLNLPGVPGISAASDNDPGILLLPKGDMAGIFSKSDALVFFPLLGWALGFLAVFVRFRLPVLVFFLALCLILVTNTAVGFVYPQLIGFWGLFICSVFCLGVAIRLDLQDRMRVTRKSAYAFWLYVIAAPLTIHALFINLIFGSKSIAESFGSEFNLSVIVIAISLFSACAGIVLDRRSLVSPTIIYIMGVLFYWFSDQLPPSVRLIIPLALGFAVIVLGTFWYRIRAWLFRPLARSALFQKLPPVAHV